MRISSLLIGAAALAFASAASAQTIEQVSFSPDFQEELEDEYGVDEGAYLNETLTRYVAEALQRRGARADGARIELTIVDAAPNRPTRQQQFDQPSIDFLRSVSIGGAELRAVIRDESGAVVDEVRHRYYSSDLRQASMSADVWGDARRSMRRFADKVATAYVAR